MPSTMVGIRRRLLTPSTPKTPPDTRGFHRAYPHPARRVDQQHREPRSPRPGRDFPRHAERAIGQGVGRTPWFGGGTDAEPVVDMAGESPEPRRSDLFGGTGPAARAAFTAAHQVGTGPYPGEEL